MDIIESNTLARAPNKLQFFFICTVFKSFCGPLNKDNHNIKCMPINNLIDILVNLKSKLLTIIN